MYLSSLFKFVLCLSLLFGSTNSVIAMEEEPSEKKIRRSLSFELLEDGSLGNPSKVEEITCENDLFCQTTICEAFKRGAKALFDKDLGTLLMYLKDGNNSMWGIIGTVGYVMARYPKLIGMYSIDGEKSEVKRLTFHWLDYAYKKGDASIEDIYGFCYLYGLGTMKDIPLSLELFQNASNRDAGLRAPPLPPLLPMSKGTAFILRLLGFETGRARFVYGDEDTNEETQQRMATFSQLKFPLAQCLLTHSIAVGKGWILEQQDKNEILVSLSQMNLPVAWWVAGNVYLSRNEVDLGLHLIFQAANALCPQAMLYMKTSFSAFETGDCFTSQVTRLMNLFNRLQSDASRLPKVDSYKGIVDLQLELSTLFKLLRDAQEGFALRCDGMDHTLAVQLKELKSPQYVFLHEDFLTFGEYNEGVVNYLLAFLKTIDEKFMKAQEALEARLRDYDIILAAKLKKVREPVKIKAIEEGIASKKERRREDIDLLQKIKRGLLDLIPKGKVSVKKE